MIIGVIYIGTESLTIMICLHAASLFEVTSYYFHTAVSIEITDSHISRKCTNDKNMSHLIKSIIMQQETIQYNTNWYETSIATQKLLQMVLLRSNNITAIRLYIFDASLRGFSVLFQSSLSYFTVLLSL
ncbi:uncharacterized protein LOC143264047 [Megachile rotundata]|uniref:uncharacterized protein LOC143264047 n=1 Tax=Megachile rotundata TaxID=143995 RepID=UPI003FD2B198